MSQFSEWLTSSLLRNSLTLVVAALIVATCIKWMRLRSPAGEQWAWLLVLIQGVMFVWLTIPVPGEWLQHATPPQPQFRPAEIDVPLTDPDPRGTNLRYDVPVRDPSEPAHQQMEVIVEAERESDLATVVSPLRAPRLPLRDRLPSWRVVFFATWVTGAGVILVLGFARYVAFVRRLRHARPAPRDWSDDWHRQCGSAGGQTAIPLLVSDNIGPALCRLPGGYRLVVPERLWQRLSAGERAAVFRHELAHLSRGDVWWTLFVRLLAGVHWFNPCAWWAARRYEAQSEFACDIAAAGDDPAVFSELLVQLASDLSRRIAGVQAVAAGSVYERVQRLLEAGRRRSGLLALVPVTVALVAVVVAGVRVEAVAKPALQRADSAVNVGPEESPAQANTPTTASIAIPAEARQELRKDSAGDPLPPGAILRLGTARLRQEIGSALTFTPDNSRLVSVGWEEPIRTWDVGTGRLIGKLNGGREERHRGLAISSDGTLLATVGGSGRIQLWDLSNDRILFEKEGHKADAYEDTVESESFSPDNQFLATVGSDGTVAVWELPTGKELKRFTIGQDGDRAGPVVFSPDGTALAAQNHGGVIHLWDLTTGSKLREIKTGVDRGETGGSDVRLAFLDAGRRLLSYGRQRLVGDDGKRTLIGDLCIWNVASGELVTRFGGGVPNFWENGFAVTRDEKTVVAAHFDGLSVWDLATTKVIRTLKSNSWNYRGVAISLDASLVSSWARDNRIRVWEIDTGNECFPQERTHTNAIVSIRFSPDGKTVATGGADGAVRLWNAATGAEQRVIATLPHAGWYRCVDFFPNGDLAVAGGETHALGEAFNGFTGIVQLVRPSDGQKVREWPTPYRVMCGAVSRDGQYVAAGVGFLDMLAPPDHVIYVWDARSGEEVCQLRGHKRTIDQIAFSADSLELWSFAEDQTLRRWDIARRKETAQVTVRTTSQMDEWRQAAFAPDRQRVVLSGIRSHEQSTGDTVREYITFIAASWRLGADSPEWISESPGFRWGNQPAYSPDGRLVAQLMVPPNGQGRPAEIVLLAAADGHELLSFPLDDGRARSLAFSPDGTRLAAGMIAGDALIFDVTEAVEKVR